MGGATRAPRSFGMFAALLLAACSSGSQEAPEMCTLIGCESGLEVVLEPRPAGALRVDASAPGLSSQTMDCPTATDCARIFFRDFTPDSVALRVTTGNDTTSWSGRPSYRTLQPNGPNCPPTCRQATVRVAPR